jgi:hypothetical protein
MTVNVFGKYLAGRVVCMTDSGACHWPVKHPNEFPGIARTPSEPKGLRLAMKTPISTKRSNLLIGTSGWTYRSWRGPFFPRDLPEQERLEFYARQFRTTELNGVFYRTPTVDSVRGWEERTPEGFIFARKASRFITHWKRLNDTSRNSLALLQDRLRLLGKKAGPVLFQLPPQFEKDRARLASFLRLLSPQQCVRVSPLELVWR